MVRTFKVGQEGDAMARARLRCVCDGQADVAPLCGHCVGSGVAVIVVTRHGMTTASRAAFAALEAAYAVAWTSPAVVAEWRRQEVPKIDAAVLACGLADAANELGKIGGW